MTTELGKVSRYEWLLANLNDPIEQTRLTEELDHFKAGAPAAEGDVPGVDEAIYTFSLESLMTESGAYRHVSMELGRAFIWAVSKYGEVYWESVREKYIDIQQAKVRADIQRVKDESRADVAAAQDTLATIAKDVADAEAERLAKETEASKADSRRGATINKDGSEGF